MGAFNKKTVIYGNPSLIPAIADRICQTFTAEGYEVKRENLISGGEDISITKGGMFKAVIGMKTALKITLVPMNDSISFEAGVGIFGQQVLPTVISMFFFWPVLITQIWGLVQQSHLDDKVLAIAQSVVSESGGGNTGRVTPPPFPGAAKFCTSCGAKLPADARFCSNCGAQL